MADNRGRVAAYPFIVQAPEDYQPRNEERFRAQMAQANAEIFDRLASIETDVDAVEQGLAALPPPPVLPDFATEAEAIAGTSPDTIISPETLAAVLALLPTVSVPTGAVMHFAGNNPPGWLNCDGAAVTTANAALRDYLLAAGSPYGVVGSDPRVPDLRGEFVRGADLGRGVDAGRVFGSAQGDAIRNITGDFGYSATSGAAPRTGGTLTGPFTVGGNRTNGPSANSGLLGADLRFDASRQVPTANENRPRNVSLRACIKT